MTPDFDGRSDGRSDGQTESIMAKTALCIASYADALSKITSNPENLKHNCSLSDFLCTTVTTSKTTTHSTAIHYTKHDAQLPQRNSASAAHIEGGG